MSKEKIIPLAGLFLIFIFFARLFYPTQTIFMIPDYGESDVLHFNLPLKSYLGQSLKNNVWPLWTNQLANGFPLLAEGQIGTFYLPNLLLFKFLPLITAYNLSYVISYLFLAIGAYFLARILKFSRISSTFAALILTFSGFFSVHSNHLNLLQTASLTPFLFAFSLILWYKPRLKYSLVLAFIISQQIFAGHYYILFISLVGVFLIWLYLFFSGEIQDKKAQAGRILLLLFTFLFAVCLSSIQLFPTFELWRYSSRVGGLSFDSVTSFPYPVKHLLTFISPYLLGNPANGTYPVYSSNWGIFWENTAYMGILPLFLSFFSIFWIRSKKVKFGLLLGIISLLLVLGKFSPLYFIFSFPPFNFFRTPSKFLILTVFAITLLATVTFEKLIRMKNEKLLRLNSNLLKIILVIVILLLVLIDEFKFSYNYPPVSPAKIWLSEPEIISRIPDLKKSKIITLGSELSWNNIFLKKGWQDISPYFFYTNYLFPNYNLIQGITSFGLNTGGLIPRRISAYMDGTRSVTYDQEKNTAALNKLSLNALKLAGVKYLISSFKIAGEKDIEKISTLVAQSPQDNSDIYVYQLKNSFADFYISGKAEKITTLQDVYDELEKDSTLSDKKVLVEDENLFRQFENSPLKINAEIENIDRDNELETIKVRTDQPGILVRNTNNYPGWEAYDYLKQIRIYNANLTYQGVALSKGEHEIRFVFNSRSFELGKKITIAAWFTIYLILLLDRVYSHHKASRTRQLFPDL